jgi:TPR repeat protein/predicted phosphohydrolase
MRKIKVLQIGGNAQKNGITTYILNVYERISEKFTFVCINTAFRDANIEVKNKICELGGKIYHLPYNGNIADIENDARKLIRDEQPDVIHAHYFSSNGDFLRIACEEDIPVRISHCHNNKTGYLTSDEQTAIDRQRDLIEQYATVKLACSAAGGKFLYKEYSFQNIGYCLNTKTFYPITDKKYLFEKYKIDSSYKYSIFIGRFAFQKNTPFLIDIAKPFKERKIIIVGDGDEKAKFIQRIQTENLEDKFVFIDDVGNLNELYNLADSLLLPSFYEGFGIVLVEAQCAGIPCFASEFVPRDADLGLVTYLPLKAELWTAELNTIAVSDYQNIDRSKFDGEKNIDKLISVYTSGNSIGELYIRQGKEYTLGSKRVTNNWKKVAENFRKAHELENPRGTFYYALQYFEGNGVEKNIKYAKSLVDKVASKIGKEAENGNSDYILILADMYSFGLGKQQSFETAFKWYLKAAEKGNAEAMCDLGYMYSAGQGTKKNLQQSFYWYTQSAERGYLHAIRDAGLCYYFGLGTPVNTEKAVEYFQSASDANYAHATSDLAFCYLEGKGVEQNEKKAVELFLRAVQQERNRTLRDLIAHNLDVDELLQNRRLIPIKREKIDRIDHNVLVDTTVVIPTNIREIDLNLFYGQKNINKFFVEKDNQYYFAVGGVLYSKDKSTLIRFPIGSAIKEFEVPKLVKVLGKSCFQNCRNMQKIILHEQITHIEDSAFDDCKSLSSVDIPKSVVFIGAWAFHGCDKLKKIALSENVKTIGEYAFGSCENLKEIIVSEKNKFFCSLHGNLYSKNFDTLFQYAIGKKEKLFALPQKTKRIAFRAFSDAYRLEDVSATRAESIGEKAFYYCKKLRKISLPENCRINGAQVFNFVSNKFQITRSEPGRTILFADIHGHLRLDFIKHKTSALCLQKNDVIIILGDAGIVWANPMNEAVKHFYSSLPCNTLFLDGNHENFTLLNTLQQVEKYGSKVHKVLDNVFHLTRGNVYLINGYKYFIFGGAYSIKKETATSPVNVWEEEMPNLTEYKNGLQRLKENSFSFDYILTHQAPKSVLDSIGYYYSNNETVLLDYFDGIKKSADFNRWYFGHIHQDIKNGKFCGLYNEIEVIE